ncbi:hypothetical protein LR48_Vigan08g021200 [Vigna angularis]|uniref:Uncharacterized protein n=1 Tax=Phaseolus angularis TaxID=3914 RepID=A0A0L9V2P7_PHAAN|nr:hypothetical protein LR48_Vigan08g021200 [Vigna angularis]
MMEVAIEKMFAVWFSLQMSVDGDVRRWCSGMVEIASRVVSATTTSTPIGFLDLCISLADVMDWTSIKEELNAKNNNLTRDLEDFVDENDDNSATTYPGCARKSSYLDKIEYSNNIKSSHNSTLISITQH